MLRAFPKEMTIGFHMLRLLLLTALIGGLAFAAPSEVQAQQANGSTDREVVDEIAAVVGDEIILRSEVDGMVRQILQQQPQGSYSPDLWEQALDELINQQLLVEEAKRDTNITVSDEQVEQVLDERFEQIIQQAGGEEEVERLYGQSILQLREEFREDFREQLLAEQLRNQRMQNVRITPSEVREWFEQVSSQDSLPEVPETVRLAHIVRYPKVSESAREEAREMIAAIRDSAMAGVPIEELARRYSDDERSAARGGRYENFPLGDLEPSFAAVASRAPVGEISRVFEGRNGFHILRVNERRGNTVDFNHVLIEISDRAVDGSQAESHLSAVRDSIQQFSLPFELMAARHSEEEQSSQNGGRVLVPQTGERDLVLEALDSSWRSTIDTLQIGEISEPTEVELLNGERAYHIVKLERRIPAHRMSLATDYDRIREAALREKQQRVLQEWIGELRDEIYIDVRIEPEEVASAR